MSSAARSPKPTASPSSSSSLSHSATMTTTTTSRQDGAQARSPDPSAAVSTLLLLSNGRPLGSDSSSSSDLSDAPESPVFPTSPTTSSSSPSSSSNHASDSDLSSAPPDSPIWPSGSPPPKKAAPPTPPRHRRCRCTEKDCPVRKAVRDHDQGPYLHNRKPPQTNGTIFSASNPPPHVWESWRKIQAQEPGSTVEDDWNVLGFLRWHVEDPNVGLMGI